MVTVNFRQTLSLSGRSDSVEDLEQRVADLELAVAEMRRHNLRLAELADVVQELLVPLASRDEERIRAAIDAFGESI
ncbi:hypothetical protein EXE57_06395 [Nocardioides euryhalodurans]|uniref:DUF6752 domain-containing protein n=1 Tax=Nocardioides euryhalodurans TaxID=2518370 RepID=A0A4P7GJM1_9ACTN|nr:hypothetical protein EXE57_06395 [Nocardioides euryhalodurans]